MKSTLRLVRPCGPLRTRLAEDEMTSGSLGRGGAVTSGGLNPGAQWQVSLAPGMAVGTVDGVKASGGRMQGLTMGKWRVVWLKSVLRRKSDATLLLYRYNAVRCGLLGPSIFSDHVCTNLSQDFDGRGHQTNERCRDVRDSAFFPCSPSGKALVV